MSVQAGNRTNYFRLFLANGTILPDGIEADVAASGQSGFAAQGGLPGAAAVLAAISRRSTTGMEERRGNFPRRGAQRGDALRILAFLPTGGIIPPAFQMRPALARGRRGQNQSAAATGFATGRGIENARVRR